jgi:hypothetical protein
MAIGKYQVQKVFLRLSETKIRAGKGGGKKDLKGKVYLNITANSEEPGMELSCRILHGIAQ